MSVWSSNFNNVSGWTTTGSSTGSNVTITNSTSTAITAIDDSAWQIDSWASRRIHSLKEFNGHLKLINEAGRISFEDGSELELDDFGNLSIFEGRKKTIFQNNHKLKPGQCLLMPDGTRIRMGHNDRYTIEDENAKVLYKGCDKREFNKYVNASELLGDFVGDLGKIGVIQSKVLKTPIEYFINWLIHRAAEQDEDEHAAKDVPTLIESKPALVVYKPRCKYCCKFITKKRADSGINFCNAEHMTKYEMKMGL